MPASPGDYFAAAFGAPPEPTRPPAPPAPNDAGIDADPPTSRDTFAELATGSTELSDYSRARRAAEATEVRRRRAASAPPTAPVLPNINRLRGSGLPPLPFTTRKAHP